MRDKQPFPHNRHSLKGPSMKDLAHRRWRRRARELWRLVRRDWGRRDAA